MISTLKRIGKAYFLLIKNAFFLAVFIAAVTATGFAISYPLWIFATRSQRGYSITSLIVLACGVAGLIFMRIRRAGKSSPTKRLKNKKKIARGFLYTGSILGFIALLYIIVFFFSQGLLFFGIPFLILFLFLLGLFLYDIGKTRA